MNLSMVNFLNGHSRVFRSLIETANLYAKSDWPILLMGETGVGKELLARYLHQNSERDKKPFIPVNCGAIPPGLFESELFGFERGSFSGASQSSKGILREAHGGTLFLDEVGELELTLQVKLLRLLDSGEVRSIGGKRVERVDVRILAATNVDLHRAVSEKNFRHDLLERLCVLTLRIPPLRERLEDIESIALEIGSHLGLPLPEEGVRILSQYDWPGNIRQLRNLLIRAAVKGGDRKAVSLAMIIKLLREERALSARFASTINLADASLADIEKQVIENRLERHQGNRKRTAKELGIAKSTLHEKLRRWTREEDPVSWPGSRCRAAFARPFVER